MAINDVKEVAKYFIKISNSCGVEISNLKLQKLVYYAQAWFVTLNDGKPLFGDQIEAWVLGPAIPSLFQEYRKFGSGPIVQTINEDSIKLSKETIQFLDQVYKAYGDLKASELVQLTHSEDPWLKARSGLDMMTPSNNIITTDSMMVYYSKLLSTNA